MKAFGSVLLFIFIPFLCLAQQGSVVTDTSAGPCSGFQLSLGTAANERAYDIAVADNNEFYTAGSFANGFGGNDILVIRHSSGGAVKWSRIFGGSGNESVRKIHSTGDGGIIVTGQTNSFGNNSGDILCFKLDKNGSLLWGRKFGIGSPYGDLGMDIIETTDGGFAVSGILNVHGGVADAVVIKLDNAANPIWSERLDHMDGDDGVGLVQNGDTLIVAIDLQHSAGNYEFTVNKILISDGTVVASKKYTPLSRGLFNPYILKNPARSGYIISGHTIDGDSYANMKHTVFTLDDNLNIVNSQLLSFPTVTNDFFTGIQPLPDGSFIGCASPQNNADGYLYRIKADNTVVYSKRYNAASDRRLYRLATAGETIIAAGGAMINGQEDFFVTSLNIDGQTRAGCTLEDVPATVENPQYNAQDYTWPSISAVNFQSVGIALLQKDISVTTNDLCPHIPAEFTFRQNTCDPWTVQFHTNLTGVQNYQWDFGNGQTATNETSPIANYKAYGSYIVQLKATSGSGCIDSLSKPLAIGVTLDKSLIQQSDTAICVGDSVLLTLTEGQLGTCWYGTPDFSTSPFYVKPQQTSRYYLTSLFEGPNLLSNGAFNGGNQGFTTDYFLSASNSGPALFAVGSNSSSWYPVTDGCSGQSPLSGGNMLLVSGSSQPGKNVWQERVSVQPNTTYVFQYAVRGLEKISNAQLQTFINGIPADATIAVTSCTWQRRNFAWNSGSDTAATISIQDTVLQSAGNNFALDDLFFGTAEMKTDSLTIAVNGTCSKLNIAGPSNVCSFNQKVRFAISRATGCSQPYIVGLDNTFASVVSQTPDSLLLNFKKNGPTTVRVVINDGCHITADSVLVTVHAAPDSINLGKGITTCRDTSIVLNAGAGFSTYHWQDGNSDSIYVVNKPGTYSVTATNDCGAVFEDSFQFQNVSPVPFSVSPLSVTACARDSIQLHAEGGTSYDWEPAVNFSNNGAASPEAVVNKSGNFSIHITDQVCNRDTLINIPVVAGAGPQVQILKSNDVTCTNDSATLKATGALQYVWSPDLYVVRRAGDQITVKPFQNFTYYVTGTDAAGCHGKDSVTVTFTKEGIQKLVVPNAFTPNYDGKNDVLKPIFTGPVIRYDFRIFNRWGQLLFQSSTPGIGWDGTFGHVAQPADAYVYMISITGGCEGTYFKKGTFVLIR